MKVILEPQIAHEMLVNEDMIRNQEGPYRPIFDPSRKVFVSRIKCFPFEKLEGGFIQQRDVIPGMEGEVDDVCMAKIENGTIRYKRNGYMWEPGFDMNNMPNRLPAMKMENYSMMVYTPKFNNDTIFVTDESLGGLFEKMKEYRLFMNVDTDGIELTEGIGEMLDKEFMKYQGICTYILFEGENICRCGKWDNKKEW